MKNQYNLVVIGGGAAGMFCAVNAAENLPKGEVLVVEKSLRTLQKVKVSGGGRCNVTHESPHVSHLVSNYPVSRTFLKKSFQHFNHADTVEWFNARGVQLHTEQDGRMFPVTNSSETIITCLLSEAQKHEAEIRLGFDVQHIQQECDLFKITARSGQEVFATCVCVACGGLPKREQYKWLTEFSGHTIIEPVPSLFTFNAPQHPISSLSGLSANVKLKISGLKQESEGPLLITHWGVSGPAVLRLSAFSSRDLYNAGYKFSLIINWLPEFHETSLLQQFQVHRHQHANQLIVNTPFLKLPNRLKIFLLGEAGIDADTTWVSLKASQQNALAKTLCSYNLSCSGKTTFKEEFVTSGGISTAEIEASAMESKLVRGLYFAGEIMDVDGVTGGFNFQHAWTSGILAARSICRTISSQIFL